MIEFSTCPKCPNCGTEMKVVDNWAKHEPISYGYFGMRLDLPHKEIKPRPVEPLLFRCSKCGLELEGEDFGE